MRFVRVTGREGLFRVIRRGERHTRVLSVEERESCLVPTTDVEELASDSSDLPAIAVPAEQSNFRCWMNRLLDGWGPNPEWPSLLFWLLEAEFQRQQSKARTYPGDVFKDRDEEVLGRAEECDAIRNGVWGEERLTQALYDRCHFGSTMCDSSAGCLTIGGDSYWLLGYEFPTCDGPADLVGLTASGALAVFECKGAANGYSPIGAILEGLDYLASLVSEGNFAKLALGFDKWRHGLSPKRIPTGFDDVRPKRDASHEAIVLAPLEYFERYSRSPRGFGCGQENALRHWQALSLQGRSSTHSIKFGLATCDFLRTTRAEWLQV